MERREAPRSLRGSVRPALRSAGLRAELPGPKSLEGGGGPGARGPLRRARRLPALHRGTRCRRPHPAPSSAVAIDDALERARQSRWYRGGKRTEGLFELRCEFAGESANAGIAQPDQSPSCHHRAAPKARAPIALPPTKIFLREAGWTAVAG